MTLPIEAEFLGHFPLPAGSGPTALRVRRDMSAEAARASGGYAAWDGSQQAVVPEAACVCGGVIVPDTKAPADVLAAVQIHNQTPLHRRWREAREDEA